MPPKIIQGAPGIGAGPWVAWVPVYSTNVGDAAASFNGAVVTTLARYQRSGKGCIATVSFSGTLLAIAPTSIFATFPLNLKNPDTYSAGAFLVDGVVLSAGLVRTDSTSVQRLGFQKINIAAWTALAVFDCRCAFAFELA